MTTDKATEKKLMPGVSYTYVTRPKVLCHSSGKIRNILRSGNVEKVEKLIKEGYGHKLIGETSPFPKIKVLLKAVPFYMARIDMLHEAVVKGQLRDVQMLLNTTSTACSVLKTKPENLALSKDSTGTGLLHKAVFYDYFDIIEWLAKNYPATIHSRDKLGRIPLHYVNSTSDPDKIWDLLVGLGSDVNAEDHQGKTPLYFLTNETEVQLPDKVLNVHKPQITETNTIKSSNIRIWIHDQDLNKLQQVIWDGQGDKLKTETSNKRLMKKFLNGVPHIMSVIQEVHRATITNEINKLKLNSRNPIPAVILSSKDAKGVTPLHKAAGLGHDGIVNYILSRYPEAIHIYDNDGRTALHYAASFNKDDIYDLLLKFGANENIIDKFGRSAKCYQCRQNDIDTDVLYEIPTAPRTGVATGYPSSWDWSILSDSDSINNLNEKIPSARILHNTVNKKDETSNNLQINYENPKKFKTNSYDSSNIENDSVPVIEEAFTTASIPEANSEQEIKDINHNVTRENETRPDLITEPVQEFTRDEQNLEDTSQPDLQSQIVTENSLLNNEDDQVTDDLIILHSEFDEIVDNYESVIEEEFIDTTLLKKKLNVDHKVKQIMQQKNFDEIGNFILQGCGEFLLNEKSSYPEIQEFINNLPIYLKKIELIHHCCEIGNLEELQKYLDRRKLAVVRENKTGLYLTPLHVAVINNHRDIARYLGGRFPETFKVIDKFGRTPLHFASIHPKGSYIYNMLLTLGADKYVKDCNDRTPEYYYQNKNEARYNQLFDIIQKSKKNTSKGLEKIEEEFNSMSEPEKEHFIPESELDKPDHELPSGRLGTAIRTGLSAIASERPPKPIKFLANYLNNYDDEPTVLKDEPVTPPVIENTPSQSDELEINQTDPQPEENIPDASSPVEIPTIDVENQEIPSLPQKQELQTVRKENEKDEEETRSSEDEKKAPNRKNSIINYKEEINNQFQPISRDKHGQSMLHFAAASRHSRNALLQTLQELDANISQRDELYRTARDIAVFSQLYDNVKAIDDYVFHLAVNGQTDKILQLLLDGYDHILELETEENVMDVVKSRNHEKTLHILQTINIFEEIREDLHAAIRIGNKLRVQEIFNKCGRDAKLMAICKNDASRCSLHISVLTQHKDIVKYIVKKYPKTIHIGDNLERTPLHYAMGLKSVEELSRILIDAGATRVVKDLDGSPAIIS
ncbi:uncharacterized protein LOC135831544 isoform X2 [Planococcus citri]|uniref:uncharacterized protein LOC135831544 isoform X2 n=1 Tax=Planococcus citri TaxID=170843 RepID=UPI0031F8F2F8